MERENQLCNYSFKYGFEFQSKKKSLFKYLNGNLVQTNSMNLFIIFNKYLNIYRLLIEIIIQIHPLLFIIVDIDLIWYIRLSDILYKQIMIYF
ncbi:hypothetical protein pb186bvf_003751 [Paramecium bursaria]